MFGYSTVHPLRIVKQSAMVVSALFLMTTAAQAQEVIPGEFIVKYKDSPHVASLSIRSNVSTSIADHNINSQIFKVRIQQSNEIEALLGLMRDPNIEYIVPNFRVHLQLVESGFSQLFQDASTQEQWANKTSRVEEGWAVAGNKGSRRIKVAVIDTGMDSRHSNLASNAIPGYDFAENDSDPMDKTSKQNPGHGTHCSGSVGANGQSGGVSGASQEVSLMPIRFLDENGGGDLNNALKALDYAIQKGVHVVSNSWGAKVPKANALPLIEAIEKVSKAGIVVVNAAGNDGTNTDKTGVYPANAKFANTITVAASDENDKRASFSNFGRANVDIAAPGTNILSTVPNGKYQRLSGTSMATPLVSGIAAFLKSQDESLTGEQIRSVLQLTGKQVDIEVACKCRVDMEAASRVVVDRKMFIFPAAATIPPGATLQFGAKNGQGSLEFSSSNPQVASIDANGLLTANVDGEVRVTVKDQSGATSTSLPIYVATVTEDPGGGQCPLGNPMLCLISCMFEPTLPWCEGDKGGGLPFPFPLPFGQQAETVRTER